MGEMTKHLPKPMLPLGNRPMIDYAIDYIRGAGIQKLVANTHYLHDEIGPHLAERGVEISHESREILDTGGGLRAALPLLDDGPVLTMNPDAAWRGPNPVEVILSAWRPEMDALLLCVPEENAVARRHPGDFSVENGRISRSGRFVYTGVQILRREHLEEIDEKIFSLNHVWDKLIASNALSAAIYPGEWCDIGHPEGLAAAEGLLRGSNV